MSADTCDWSVRAQVRRIALMDARITGVDVLYSAFYVLGGFYLSAPHISTPVHVCAAPFIILCGILGYLATRICGPERDGKTAMFYANLPRTRMMAYWVHAGCLAAFAIAMELIIALALLSRLNAAHPDQFLTATPVLMVLPLFVISAIAWACYGNYRSLITLPVVLTLLLIVGVIIVWDWERYEKMGRRLGQVPEDTARAMTELISGQSTWTALGLLIVAGVLMWHGSYRWAKTQPGALT